MAHCLRVVRVLLVAVAAVVVMAVVAAVVVEVNWLDDGLFIQRAAQPASNAAQDSLCIPSAQLVAF